jgi:hypothetical protein
MSERRLARDPLADLLPPEPGRPTASPNNSTTAAPGTNQSEPPRSKVGGQDRITVQVDERLAEQARDAVMWLHRVGVHTTISAIAAAGLRTELDRLAALHNDGGAFPPRQGDVPVGRPPRP